MGRQKQNIHYSSNEIKELKQLLAQHKRIKELSNMEEEMWQDGEELGEMIEDFYDNTTYVFERLCKKLGISEA